MRKSTAGKNLGSCWDLSPGLCDTCKTLLALIYCGVFLAVLVTFITNENSSSQFYPWLYFPFSLYTSLFMSVINTKPMNSIRSGTDQYLSCSQRLGRYLEVYKNVIKSGFKESTLHKMMCLEFDSLRKIPSASKKVKNIF